MRTLTAFAIGLTLLLALALQPRGAYAQLAPLSGTLLSSQTTSAATLTSTDRTNSGWRGVMVIVNISARIGGTYTPKIQGKDPLSGNYFDLLVGSSLATTTTTSLTVYPGVASVTNMSANNVLPATWRVVLTGSSASMTVSTSFVLLP